MITHASIVPLMGSATLAADEVFENDSKYLLSYSDYEVNDSHLVHYYKQTNKDVPYTFVTGDTVPEYVDVVTTQCYPGALASFSDDVYPGNHQNNEIEKVTTFVLNKIKPKVFWGEAAPSFSHTIGKRIRMKLAALATANGYSMSVFRSKATFHGSPQVRQRSFFIFWKEVRNVPILKFFETVCVPVKDLIPSLKGDTQHHLVNSQDPIDNPYYHYLMDQIHPNTTHEDFIDSLLQSYDVIQYMREQGVEYREMTLWFNSNGYESESIKIKEQYISTNKKLDSSGVLLPRSVFAPKQHINGFVKHLPRTMMHPVIRRHLTYRECMGFMGFPEDFEMLNPEKNLDHVCENIIGDVAKDILGEIKAYLEGNREMVRCDMVIQYNEIKKTKLINPDTTGDVGGLSNFLT